MTEHLDVAGGTIPGLFVGLWSSTLASFAASPFIFKGLLRLKARQNVSQYVPEHQAKQGTPTMGGLIPLVGMVVAYLVVRLGIAAEEQSASWVILILGFGLVGFVDDFVVPRLLNGKRGLGWTQKLLLQFLFAIPAAQYLGYEHPGEVGLALLIIVAFSNAFNFSDGMDGLAGGIAVMMALSLALIGILFGAPWWHAALCMALVGSLIPFLFLNAPPAKVFMGDVGALPIGACLGWLALRSAGSGALRFEPNGWLASITVLSLLLMVELFPVPLQILSVKLRKRKLFPMTPIHHAFQAAGWPETRVVALFHLAQALMSFASISIAFAHGMIGGFVT